MRRQSQAPIGRQSQAPMRQSGANQGAGANQAPINLVLRRAEEAERRAAEAAAASAGSGAKDGISSWVSPPSQIF